VNVVRRSVAIVAAAAVTFVTLGTAPVAGAATDAVKTTTVKVKLTDAGCPAKVRANAGRIRFEVENVDAASVSEFEILDGDDILGEKENLAPGLSGTFTVTLKSGTYTTYCPGGDREHGKLVVRGSTDLTASTAGRCVPVGDPATATGSVPVTLDEWVVDFGQPEVAAGAVEIDATNEGKRAHEVVVLRGVPADALPLDDDGALDEAGLPDGALVGEIEPFAAGTDCQGVFTLTPGEYVIVCNITNRPASPEPLSHLAKGMLTTLTVR
jgi:plastocyanin